jgi:hypothetical protein
MRAVPTTWAQRTGAVACGCALAAGALLVRANDPAVSTSRFPPCPFRATTGLWCPGCGLTRGTHHLLNGRLGDALSYNVFTPLVLAAIVFVWLGWMRRTFRRDDASPRQRTVLSVPTWITPVALIVVVGYGVLRNIPGLEALAP